MSVVSARSRAPRHPFAARPLSAHAWPWARIFALAALLLPTLGFRPACAETPDDAGAVERLHRAFLAHDAALLEGDAPLVSEKYDRMAHSAFAFYRGTAWLDDPRPSAFSSPASSQVAITGDPHPENFAVVQVPGGGRVLVLDDFDRAGYGSYIGDLRRAATGFWIAADMAKLKRRQRARVVAALVGGYVTEVRRLAAGGAATPIVAGDLFDGRVDAALVPGARRGGEAAVQGRPAAPADARLARAVIERYRSRRGERGRYTITSVYRRLAGVASFPVLRMRVVVEDPAAAAGDRDTTLEIKESLGALPARIITDINRQYDAPLGDLHRLGWASGGGRAFRVRRLIEGERRFSADRLAKLVREGHGGKRELRELAFRAGEVLALGHCTAHGRAGAPGLRAIQAALTSPEGLSAETVAAAARLSDRNHDDLKAFRTLLLRDGPTLGWQLVRATGGAAGQAPRAQTSGAD